MRRECLEAGVADPSLVGLWGGSTQKERLVMRRRRGASAYAAERELELRWAEGELVDEEDELDRHLRRPVA